MHRKEEREGGTVHRQSKNGKKHSYISPQTFYKTFLKTSFPMCEFIDQIISGPSYHTDVDSTGS